MRKGLVAGAVAAAAATTALVAHPVGAEAGTPPAASPPLVERDSCARPTGATAPSSLRPGETFVSFDVPGTVRLQVDATGVIAASTNTGCHPRAGDTVVVVGDDAVRSATPAEVTVALTAFGSGDWRQPGAWHSRS